MASVPERKVTRFPRSNGTVDRVQSLQLDPPKLDTPKPRKTLQKRKISERPSPPPRLPLDINSSRILDTQDRPTKRAIAGSESICVLGDPWHKYQRLVQEKQGGDVTIAYEKVSTFPLVAIRHIKDTLPGRLPHLARTANPNIVTLKEAFLQEESLHIVYETMAVSLSDIQASPRGNLTEYEIAAVCKEVLQGLDYLHRELRVIHGDLNCNNILLARDGPNAGTSMLQASGVVDVSVDLRSLGLVMMRLMELGTSMKWPDDLELQHPENWSQEARSFLQKTKSSNCSSLLTVRISMLVICVYAQSA
ncbi:MAG: hypothetical protein M4579_005220 [Chaenotheca gracillima]|nr:MAG: hypothetical protein M4579_005220 [Chaenotheca gracillima]